MQVAKGTADDTNTGQQRRRTLPLSERRLRALSMEFVLSFARRCCACRVGLTDLTALSFNLGEESLACGEVALLDGGCGRTNRTPLSHLPPAANQMFVFTHLQAPKTPLACTCALFMDPTL